MSRFFPHATHAEEQPLAHTLLASHVLYRGFQTGAVIGLASFSLRSLSSRSKPSLLRVVGRSSLITTALMVPALYGRMWGKEEIEWQDRAWRLLENRGQVEVDDFSGVGTVGGLLGGVMRGGGVVRVLGSAGLGSLVGVGAYMGWRYGVKGGKWEER